MSDFVVLAECPSCYELLGKFDKEISSVNDLAFAGGAKVSTGSHKTLYKEMEAVGYYAYWKKLRSETGFSKIRNSKCFT